MGQTPSLSLSRCSSCNLHTHPMNTIHGLYCTDEKPGYREAACLLSRLPRQGQASGDFSGAHVLYNYIATSEEEAWAFTPFGSTHHSSHSMTPSG